MISSRPAFRSRGFAMVIALALVTLLVSTAAAVAIVTSTGTTRAGWRTAELDHRWAVESILQLVPELRRLGVSRVDDRRDEPVRIPVGRCEAFVLILEYRPRLMLGDAKSRVAHGTLVALANDHGLPAEGVVLRPILDPEVSEGYPAFVWFDQIVEPREPDDIFRWLGTDPGEPDAVPGANRKKPWVEVLSFWPRERATHTVEVVTRVEGDTRRWIAFVALTDREASVLHCTTVP